MAYKQKGFTAFTAKDDDEKVKSTISDKRASKINIENISAVQNKGGKNSRDCENIRIFLFGVFRT